MIASILLILVCVGIIIGCICRVNLLKSGKHRASWAVLYTTWAVFACGLIIDTCVGREVDWWVVVGLLGVLLQLYLTHKDWGTCAPPDLEHRTCPR